LGVIHQRYMGLLVMAVDHECEVFTNLRVDQQHYHLAVALFRTMVWTAAILLRGAGGLQVEGLYELKSNPFQALHDSAGSSFAIHVYC
jgi:hypothetical protein